MENEEKKEIEYEERQGENIIAKEESREKEEKQEQ